MAHEKRSAGARWVRLALAMAIASMLALMPAVSVAEISSASDPVALSANAQSTRFVIGLDKPVEFQVFSLANPNRVIVDLPDAKLRLPTQPDGAPVGLVKSFRGGASAPGRARVVIDVLAPVIVERSVVERGGDGRSARLVIDIAPVTANTWRADVKAASLTAAEMDFQPPVPRPAVSPAVKAARGYRPVIVIDPGHGGHDSGAQKNGTVEKDVVLAFGLALRKKLEATGRYRVLMTRDNDTFVELDDRRAFAERNQAALFIAIHADYASNSARGATIYSLRESVAEDLKRSAKGQAKELAGEDLKAVKAAADDVGAIKSFFADLAQREVDANQERTSVFTRSVIEYMGQSTGLKDSPDRSAAFRVLKTAQVPAVLIELAYVSNAEDAQLLRSDSWRDKVSGSIVTAVENYFSNQIARLPM
jgi:N-acetylmuramoyl-L-alanine amidase